MRLFALFAIWDYLLFTIRVFQTPHGKVWNSDGGHKYPPNRASVIINLFFYQCYLKAYISRTYTKHGPGTMDHPMDPVHGPPHGPGPWTRSMDHPYFSKGNRPCQFYMKIYRRSGYEKHRSYLLLMFLRVCLIKASCFGIAAPWMGRPQTRFEIQKI